MADYEISAEIKADSSGFTKGIKTAQSSMKNFSKTLSSFTKTISGGVLTGNLYYDGLKLITKGLKEVGTQIKKGVQDVEKYNRLQKVLAQTLEVTGANAWTSSKALNEMGDAFSKTTNYSGDEITQLQTVLLGFKNIGEETFKDTTQAILDMATVMGMDLTNATQAVGKALDDPIKGLGSLSRQGFAFTEEQKAQLEAMVAVGDMAGAQKIILDELNTTYGGAAKAGVEMGKKLKNTFSDLRREVAHNLMLDIDIKPFQESLNEALSSWQKYLRDMADVKEKSDKLMDAMEAERKGNATIEQRIILLEKERDDKKILLQQYKEYLEVVTDPVEQTNVQGAIQTLTVEIAKKDVLIQQQQKILDMGEQERIQLEERVKKENELLAIQTEREERIAKIKEDANLKLEEQERRWRAIEEVTGELIPIEDKILFYQNNLIDAMVEANGEITKGNQLYKDRLALMVKTFQQAQGSALTPQEQYERAMQDKKNRTENIEVGITETTKKEHKKREKEEKSTLDIITGMVEHYGNIIKDKIKKVFSTLKNVFKSGLNALKKLTTFNISDVLDEVLKFEDGILTFFYEMLPKLPQFIDQVLTSISHMFGSLNSYLDTIDLSEIITSMLNSLSNNSGELVNQFVDFLAKIVPEVITGFSNWIQTGGMKKFLEALLILQKGIEKVVTDNIDDLVDVIIEALPDIMDAIRESIVSASQTLSKLVGPLSKLVSEIIIQLIDVLTSQEVIDASIEAISSIVESLISDFKFTEIIISLVEGIIRIILNTPRLLGSIISGIFNGLVEKDWSQIGKKIGEAFINLLTGNLGGSKDRSGGDVALDILTGGLSSLIRGIAGKATGSNNVTSGLTLVGERGPELVDFHGGERIYTAQNTKAILNGNGMGGNNFNVTFNNIQDTSAYTMMKQLKNYNRQMAINGVL